MTTTIPGVPAPSAQLDEVGEDYDLPASTAPASRRGFRSAQLAPATPGAATTDPHRAQVDAHLSTGSPDHRRGQLTELPPVALAAAPEGFRNDRQLVDVEPIAPPDRARQGFDGSDPARPASTRRPIFSRLFDQWAAQHPVEVLKVEFDAPTAAPSRQLGNLNGGRPYPGGSTGTQRAGVGPQRNTFRILPRRWDASFTNTDPDPAPAQVSSTARSFRR